MPAAAREMAVTRSPWRGATFRLGVMVALVTAAVDQAVKFWLLYGFDLPGRGRVALTPFLDLVLAWNTGISYGLFQTPGRSANGRCSRSK